ncbi:hypothetical protein TRVL_03094 [Trypanosoma vivax]|nr:hypothetical protein TRVL_03094 [Trypanosoma vivax]
MHFLTAVGKMLDGGSGTFVHILTLCVCSKQLENVHVDERRFAVSTVRHDIILMHPPLKGSLVLLVRWMCPTYFPSCLPDLFRIFSRHAAAQRKSSTISPVIEDCTPRYW